MPAYQNGSSCPAEDSWGTPISGERNEVLILNGTDGQIYCYNIDDVRNYIMTDADFPSGLMYNKELPYPQIIEQIIPQIENDEEFIGKLESILNPPPDAFQPPQEFLRLIKRLGQCLYYFNNKGKAGNEPSTLTVRLEKRMIPITSENICRTINFLPYINAITSYMESIDDATRVGIQSLIFEGYKGRSYLFNAEIANGKKSPREITFGEYINRVFQQEECMGTTASNLINFYNKLQRNRNHPELQISKELILNSNAKRFCPRVTYTTNLSKTINPYPLFVNEEKRRKKTRRKGKHVYRKTRSKYHK